MLMSREKVEQRARNGVDRTIEREVDRNGEVSTRNESRVKV